MARVPGSSRRGTRVLFLVWADDAWNTCQKGSWYVLRRVRLLHPASGSVWARLERRSCSGLVMEDMNNLTADRERRERQRMKMMEEIRARLGGHVGPASVNSPVLGVSTRGTSSCGSGGELGSGGPVGSSVSTKKRFLLSRVMAEVGAASCGSPLVMPAASPSMGKDTEREVD